MKIHCLLALLLFPLCLYAQEVVKVGGRIVNEKGEAVEYVQIGMPEHQIGTISTADGRFEIEVPCDTLRFFHVSYQTASYPVARAADDVLIVLYGQELPPAVFIGGDTKEKYLVRPGSVIFKNHGVISIKLLRERPEGWELGTVARAKKPFLIQDILFSVRSNTIPGCVASINIYRIEGQEETFVNILKRPIYFEVAVSDSPQDFDLQPEETLLLEPGRYFIGFQIVGCDEEAMQAFLAEPEKERKPRYMEMLFPVFLKKSYVREAALGEMKVRSVNIGIAVKGLEYQ